jgi:hypothetical protein
MGEYVQHGFEISGTTTNRPDNVEEGFLYFNETLAILQVRDKAGPAWLSVLTSDGSGVYALGDSDSIELGASGEITLSTSAGDGSIDNADGGALNIGIGSTSEVRLGSVAAIVIAAGTLAQAQGDPTAETTAVTLTGAELLTRIITGTHTTGADVDYTLPTGTAMDTALANISDDESFEFTLINLSAALADTITLIENTGTGDFTIVGDPIVQSAHADSDQPASATFRVRKTAANTFVAYRL